MQRCVKPAGGGIATISSVPNLRDVAYLHLNALSKRYYAAVISTAA